MNDEENPRPSRTPSQTAQTSRRNPRLRLACSRCQKRKIRCDGEFPTCRNCRRASAICKDGESLRLRDMPREDNEVSKLRSRVAWLESIIRSRLPDLELAEGPLQDTGGADMDAVGLHPNQSMTDPNSTRQQEDSSAQHPIAAGLPLQPVATSARDLQHTNPSLEATSFTGDNSARSSANNNALSHEIGLVSVGSNSDPRYIGPSSGYFLARMLLSTRSRHDSVRQQNHVDQRSSTSHLLGELVEAAQGPLPLPRWDHVEKVCEAYFDVIHVQYPILHQQSFMENLKKFYDSKTLDPLVAFQAYMVIAIGSTILSRRSRSRIPGESYCFSALQYFDSLNVENSIPGLQCLLLLLIFTIHNPHMKLNVWYLNYHCIAAVLDLGLQRDITMSSGVSLLEQEMRTRIFWVVFMLDRAIATMMGRPIGLRDEACELRLPQNIDDAGLLGIASSNNNPGNDAITRMSFSIHLFKLAKINSEIKYVANSIVRDTPGYAYPPITNIQEWQAGVLQQLDQWACDIPRGGDQDHYIRTICQIRYHSLRMLLLRPSPAIPKPSAESIRKCHSSACQSIHLYDELYRKDILVHSWMTFHGLILSTITMIYCIRVVPDIARKTELDVLMNDLGISLSILSATGEHWYGAKRSRDVLDDLARNTISWIKDLAKSRPQSYVNTEQLRREDHQDDMGTMSAANILSGQAIQAPNLTTGFTTDFVQPTWWSPTFQDGGQMVIDDMWSAPFAEPFETGDSVNVDTIIRRLFEDLIPY